MKLVHYLPLYIDSLKRFTLFQFLYWILHKYIRKLVPTKFFIGRLDQYEFIEFDIVKSQLRKILNLNNLSSPNNSNFKTDFNLIHHYFNDISELLASYAKDKNRQEFENFWNIIEIQTDLEIQNNYHRFYYFQETIEINELHPEFGLKLIDEWIDRFPPSKDISWNAFNCTIRLINWFKILEKLPDGYNFDPNLWKKIQISIYQQINYISSNIEYHIPGNHVIIQFYVLWFVSVVFPIWNKIIKKMDEAEVLFKKELHNEFLDNGFHFEYSYHYHIQVTLFGMLWLIGMKNINKFVGDNELKIVKNASLMLEEFINPKGYLPMLGDNCFCFLTRNLYEDIELFQILKPKALEGVFEKEMSKSVMDVKGSYVLARSFESEIIFDVGNIGLANNPGHGHSDLLSIIYSYKGNPIFVDPGIKKYSSTPTTLALKKATSHNTISIAGNDQAKLWGFFRWAYLPKNLNYTVNNCENNIVLKGEYEGFRTNGWIIHKRKISLDKIGLNIEDSIPKLKHKSLTLNYILHPDVSAMQENKNTVRLLVNNITLMLSIFSEHELNLSVVPFYVYPSYDIEYPTNKITINFNTDGSSFFAKTSVLIQLQ